MPLPKPPGPCVVGIDDWALRKGRTYGTVVVDLERRRPLDLLPDRSAETWAAWLRREPQIRLVARDRSTEYARSTTLGAPTAVQVADRWHLLLNTRQMIERWLARVHPRLKLLPATTAPAPSTQRIRAYPRAPAEMLARAAVVDRWEELYHDASPALSPPTPSTSRLKSIPQTVCIPRVVHSASLRISDSGRLDTLPSRSSHHRICRITSPRTFAERVDPQPVFA
ncbi:hypothetical protein GCM10025880_09420 [Methylorubrum aminovorans]|nr:hypothetical protein GCM10025880_09420 [Methylorubrum aminovorans]